MAQGQHLPRDRLNPFTYPVLIIGISFILVVGCVVLPFCIRELRKRWFQQRQQLRQQQTRARVTARVTGRITGRVATTTRTTTLHNQEQQRNTAGGKEQNKKMIRQRVLQVVMAKQKLNDSQSFQYDTQANSYRWAGNKNSECAICLEKIEKGDTIVSTVCNHAFHHECVGRWLEMEDECPICRHKMWDEETYKMVEESIQALQS